MSDDRPAIARPPAHPTCVCGKTLYSSERTAREAHSKAHWRIRVYRCTRGGNGWHVTNGEKHENRRRW